MSDEFKQRALRHMGWANLEMLKILSGLSSDTLNFSAWNSEWTVAKVVHHIVISQGRLISRATGEAAPKEIDVPLTATDIEALVPIFKERDAHMLALANLPERVLKFQRFGMDTEFLTTTILVQAVHHAAEHRTQISDILAANRMDVFNLDELDLWHFEGWERNR